MEVPHSVCAAWPLEGCVGAGDGEEHPAAQHTQHRANPLESGTCPKVCSPRWGWYGRLAWASWHRGGRGDTSTVSRAVLGSWVGDWDAG